MLNGATLTSADAAAAAAAATVVADSAACIGCGACCFSELAEYVQVTGDDYERLGEVAEQYADFNGKSAHLRMNEGHCSALILSAEGATFVCAIYAIRPTTCRDLARGSGECNAEQHAKSQRGPAALLQLGRRRQGNE